ncbi:hypothetical protein NQ315_013075 [Exocentrus adspersus]|uniref:Uncharacterized protein n=1 Tax=Exocentrus adspersus TaxID=1586481 RepID=A0AAV8VWR0_9CUCU|nr:hypothetical protein NQ315_013854 [Exocentrus adspersus]KAJ8918570.1 hypothetical protein NQ315_013075 [Exocentrus adspersus]
MLAWYFLYFQEYYHDSMNREMFEKWVKEKLLPNLEEPSFGLFILEEFIIEVRRRATLNLELNGIGNGMEVNSRRDHGR